jgi:hypothetical protein
VLVSTHALIVTDEVRFRTISGAAAEASLEKPDHRTSFLVSLKQSRRAAVITVNHLSTSTRPPRSHDARVAASAHATPRAHSLYSLRSCRHHSYTFLFTSTRPLRSHNARVAAPALAHRLCRSVSLRNAPCTPPLFTQLPSQQHVTQRDNYSRVIIIGIKQKK